MKTNRLGGHAMRNEGRVLNERRELVNGEGRVRCQCGALSPVLPNTNARKHWHREHKDDMRQNWGRR